MNLESIGKMIIGLAVFLFIFGLIIFALGRGFGFNGLPGDIIYRRGNTTVYFPIVTAIVVSIILTVLLNVFFYFLRR